MKKPILPTGIVLRFHPSKFLWGWWLVFSMAVLLSLCACLPLSWAMTWVIIYAIACVWQWTQLLATCWQFSPQSLQVDVYGQMTVTNAAGQRWVVHVLSDSVVHHRLMVLHIDYLELQHETAEKEIPLSGRKMWQWLRPTRLLILSDHADTEAQKALRVWLTWGLRE
ncbi:MAG: hypothetical protein ACTS9Y_14695 [Methylophilus sp.]|uniref:hypothetical protein n=1 Tax=Methylophilus sp. TaxID=29541 RepID=UPI003FA07418